MGGGDPGPGRLDLDAYQDWLATTLSRLATAHGWAAPA
jgi:hypothetical protein